MGIAAGDCGQSWRSETSVTPPLLRSAPAHVGPLQQEIRIFYSTKLKLLFNKIKHSPTGFFLWFLRVKAPGNSHCAPTVCGTACAVDFVSEFFRGGIHVESSLFASKPAGARFTGRPSDSLRLGTPRRGRVCTLRSSRAHRRG